MHPLKGTYDENHPFEAVWTAVCRCSVSTVILGWYKGISCFFFKFLMWKRDQNSSHFEANHNVMKECGFPAQRIDWHPRINMPL